MEIRERKKQHNKQVVIIRRKCTSFKSRIPHKKVCNLASNKANSKHYGPNCGEKVWLFLKEFYMFTRQKILTKHKKKNIHLYNIVISYYCMYNVA